MQHNQMVQYEHLTLVTDLKKVDKVKRVLERLDWLLSSKKSFKVLEDEDILGKTVWTQFGEWMIQILNCLDSSLRR